MKGNQKKEKWFSRTDASEILGNKLQSGELENATEIKEAFENMVKEQEEEFLENERQKKEYENKFKKGLKLGIVGILAGLVVLSTFSYFVLLVNTNNVITPTFNVKVSFNLMLALVFAMMVVIFFLSIHARTLSKMALRANLENRKLIEENGRLIKSNKSLLTLALDVGTKSDKEIKEELLKISDEIVELSKFIKENGEV